MALVKEKQTSLAVDISARRGGQYFEARQRQQQQQPPGESRRLRMGVCT